MKSIRIIILVLVLSAMAVGYFFYLSSKNNEDSYNDEDVEVSEVFKVISKDLVNDYPATPRDVIRFYISIQQCIYNEEYTDDEFVKMITQARLLMDEELLSSNPFQQYFEDVSKDVSDKKESATTFTSFILAKNSEVKYTVFQEMNYANVACIYYFKNKDGTSTSSQEYILRKDAQGYWKILASNLATQDE